MALLASAAALAAEPEVLPFPPGVDAPPGLAERAAAQRATAKDFGVYIDFGFTDRQPESGIDFRQRVVADGAKDYKAVHYDHGNGVAVADIDGDGLYDIYFCTQVGANGLYRNLGNGHFENVTEAAGVALDDRIGVTASFVDIDNDGDPDLYVTAVRSGNRLFENDGKGHFKDITEGSGLGYKGHSSAAVFFDYDRDGLLDLYLVNVGEYTADLEVKTDYQGYPYTYYLGYKDAFSGHLYPRRTENSILFHHAQGNTFEDASATMYLADYGWSGDASPIDVNGDGWPDLYELNMQGHDQYYENLQGKGFLLKSRAVFPKTSWGAMGIKAFDWNNDGRMDIFITDMHSDMSQQVGQDKEKLKSDMQWPEEHLRSGGMSIYGNTFFEQQADGSFAEISDRIGAENYWPWGLSVGDLNADGYQDVFITSGMNYPFRYGVNSLLINDRGQTFRDAEFILGVEPRRDGRSMTWWFDLDCGGVERPRFVQECGDRHGPVALYAALASRSSVMFDLDGDGDLDIVTNDFNSEPMVLISDLAQKLGDRLRYLKVRLIGTQSNRSGLGARVVVTTDKGVYTQVLDGKSGYLSQSLMPLYFGLGEASAVNSVEVSWPSGQVQKIEDQLKLNSLLEIREPAPGTDQAG